MLLPARELHGESGAPAQHLLVRQFRQVEVAGGQFHDAFFHGAHQPAPLFRAGARQKLFHLPEALAGEFEAAIRGAVLLRRRKRQRQGLAHEIGMLARDNLLPLGVAHVDVAVLHHENSPSRRFPRRGQARSGSRGEGGETASGQVPAQRGVITAHDRLSDFRS